MIEAELLLAEREAEDQWEAQPGCGQDVHVDRAASAVEYLPEGIRAVDIYSCQSCCRRSCKRIWLQPNNHHHLFRFRIINPANVRPGSECPKNAASDSSIIEKIGSKRSQQNISTASNAFPYLIHSEAVWQFTGAANFNTIIENEELDRVLDEVVTVNQGINQQFFKNYFRHL